MDPDDYKEPNKEKDTKADTSIEILEASGQIEEPIHEHTIEDIRNGFFPENVNMRTILQALLGIHEELKGIRIALETK